MDVLMGSIDVRDLLSTQDLDATSPLSAPDLRLLVDRLQIRSLHIKDKVRSYVSAHHQDFADIFARCARASAASDAAADALADALRVLSADRPADLEIRDLAREIRERRRELDDRRAALSLLETISELLDRIRTAREDLEAGRLVEASSALRDLKAAVLVEEESRDDEPVVYGLLRKEWAECFDELQDVLARHVGSCVQFEPENARMIVHSRSRVGNAGEAELFTALEAMEPDMELGEQYWFLFLREGITCAPLKAVPGRRSSTGIAGVMDYGLARVADWTIKHVINPAIILGSIHVHVELLQDSLEKSEAILSLVQSSEHQEHLGGATIYPRLIEVIKFIYKFICFENHKWMQCFGRLSWSRTSDLIINHFLSKVVPDDDSPVVPFQHVIDSTIVFESSLKEMMFISRTDSSEERLSNFAHNVEVHFASRKRNEILAKARSILLQFDSVISLENMSKDPLQTAVIAESSSKHVADLLFQAERCYISRAVSQLMELVHETLKDVCASSTRVAHEFYHAARDALLLYKAIIPIKLVKQLDSISQEAIVVHNDCFYLSQEILALSFEYRTDFPSGLKEYAVFIDMAPKFYEMSEIVLEKQLQLVLNSLRDAIDEANGFQNTHQPQQYESSKFCIDKVVFILEKVHIMWEPLMPPSTYRGTMRTLLDSVFSRFTKDMLLLDDIAAEETLQLQRLIHIILENLSSLLESLLADVDEKEQLLKNRMWVRLDELIPSVSKFRKLADLFDMPLKSITTTWESGELVSCGFTSSEVENFIKAIFQDSPLRRECLWRIANTTS